MTASLPREHRRRVWIVGTSAALILAAGWAALAFSTRPSSVIVPGGSWRVRTRVQTGHQRAEAVTFLDGGKRLAVACPRYDRVVIFEIDADLGMRTVADIKTRGKPMALAEYDGQLYVLQRPSGDARHLESAFWQRYSSTGEPIGRAFDVGYDADDFAIDPVGKRAIVLLSGNAEGETNRPDSSLAGVDLSTPDAPRMAWSLPLNLGADDPTRLTMSAHATHAAVLTHDGTLVGIDLSDPKAPAETGRQSIGERPTARISFGPDDWITLPDQTGAPALDYASASDGTSDSIAWLAADQAALKLASAANGWTPAAVSLRGPGGIGDVRAMDLDHCPERSLMAVTDRAGGVHLIEFEAEPRQQN